MNSGNQEEQGGAKNYNPSARRGIHSYNNKMGRYGLDVLSNKNVRANSPGNDAEGRDEVDNVQSKMRRQMSPSLSVRKHMTQRSNSYSQDEENAADDDNSNMLSKSLPTNLPSRLSYSDDSEREDLNYSAASNSKSRFDSSYRSQALNWSNQSCEQRSPYQRKMSTSHDPKIIAESSSSNSPLYVIVTLVVGVIAVIYVYYPTMFQSQVNNYDEVLFEHNMNSLQEKYNINSDSMLQLKSGISTIFSRMDVGSFVFVYDSESNDFNPSQFDEFIDEVAHTAAKYLRNESPMKHTVLSSDLDMQEHGELIRRYRDAVDKTGVLLVKQVDTVPSDLAMAFHYYCDEYDPLVKRSAIFFTLDLANCSNSGEKKSMHDFIEKCLAGKWRTVPQENIRPLLTRVVDVIIDVTGVF